MTHSNIRKQFWVIAALQRDGGIGIGGRLPWNLPGDRMHFQRTTTGLGNPDVRNTVIMGRATYESLPASVRPLPNRCTIVVSTRLAPANEKNLHVARSYEEAMELASGLEGDIFVAGGEELYQRSVLDPLCVGIYITKVDAAEKCDRFFRFDAKDYSLDPHWPCIPMAEQGNQPGYKFQRYRRNHPEHAYLDLCREVMATGQHRGDRTGTGVRSCLGAQMRFDLSDGFPLLTTKRTFWRGIAEELLWFVRGCTDARQLAARDVHIWDANGTREFLDQRGLSHHRTGDLGPVYGFQWRHFGASYVDCDTDYTGQGVDQLAECIRLIKEEPTSRRIVMSAWNAADLERMALPPCHCMVQFYVQDGRLSAMMTQRSADLGLGVAFNIASYALLVHMVAKVCALEVGEFVHSLSDTHVYNNHIAALEEQLQRQPFPFPRLEILGEQTSIDEFTMEDLVLHNYRCHPPIKMAMAV